MKFGFIISIMAFTGFIAVGCATTPQATPQLNQAQKAYSQARDDQMVTQYAPVPLYEAEQALNKAQNAESDVERMHYAYLTERKVEIAQSLAAQRAAENQVEQLRAEQQDMLLQMRTKEADQARLEAQQAQEQVRAYRSEQQQQKLTTAQSEAEQARTELQELQQQMQDMQAQQTQRGILLTFGDMLFATNKSELKSGAERSLQQLANFLNEHPQRQVVIEGHTDSQGPQAYNRQLSQERAQAVAYTLQRLGVSADRITARGLGEDYPIAPNTNAAGRQQNRRVEIIIPDSGQQPGAGKSQPSGT